ncbi:hypothetical protein IFM89_018194 [Coptis chinensis]|uniref:YTH domain-containing family protein n=1 Tax=Coptis chinensis TaxID=261450 RepID=A0A835M3U7_9MAGN|nr:hypothetical protein IFM89_018194 [Coptis chinensis]
MSLCIKGNANSVKNISASETGPAVSLISDGDDKNNSSIVVIRRDNYNLPDFPTKYDHALFFVIKSYSEDDIHKSIKYNVWVSTPNGNRRLDSAYQDAQEKMRRKANKCPVFLFFFSYAFVNASGQFCGVAEMIGQVDFNKNMDFWQQDKWNGVFPIRFPQGMNMLNVFKNHLLKTSILDDFTFYESRQKAMYEIQLGMHDPYEDCVAAMRLYKRMRAQNHPVEEFTTSTVAHSTRCSTIYDSLKPKELEGMCSEDLLKISKPKFKSLVSGFKAKLGVLI